jgi:citrate lyase subunit gamma (acyl carrier protein)
MAEMEMKTAMAGSLESNDVLVVLREQAEEEPVIEVQSIVEKQFGRQIRESVTEVLNAFHMRKVRVSVQDRGAYDCTIKARVEGAILRYRGDA